MATRATRDLRAASARYSLHAVRNLLLAIRYSLFAIWLMSPVLCGPLAAQTPQDLEKTAEQVIRKLDLQTTLPRDPERPHFTLQLPGEVLWLVIIVAAGVLLYAFRDLIPIWQWGRGGTWTGEEAAPGDGEARAPAVVLGAADDLAAEGRFVEAMHVLLLQSL